MVCVSPELRLRLMMALAPKPTASATNVAHATEIFVPIVVVFIESFPSFWLRDPVRGSLQFLAAQRLIDVQQNLYLALAFSHAEQIPRSHAAVKLRRVLDVVCSPVQNRDRVH